MDAVSTIRKNRAERPAVYTNVDSLAAHLHLTERCLLETMTDTQTTWRVVGFDTKHDRHESHLYITDTKADAYATAIKLHPTLDVYFVEKAGQ
ncbi:hypothetical protein SXHG_00105 [Synechococcus phage MRHenn-2013a]|nr:hypothetical protein SXHG_00105 [Synechococcus phage MRHenn-2013a]